MTSDEWLEKVSDDATIAISRGGSHVRSVHAGMLKTSGTLLEDVLLEGLGAGQYHLVVAKGGSFRGSFTCKVGNPEEVETPLMAKKHEEAVAALTAENEKLKSAQEGGMGNTLAGLGAFLTPILTPVLAQVGKGGGSGGGMQPEQFVALVEMVKGLVPPPPPPPGDTDPDFFTGLAQHFGPAIGKALEAKMGGLAGTQESEGGGVGYTQGDGPAEGDQMNPAVAQFFGILDTAAQAGDTESVVEGVLSGLNTAREWQLDSHPMIARFSTEPEEAFDALVVPNVPSMSGEMAATVRAEVAEAIRGSVAEAEEQTVAETTAEAEQAV